MCDITDFDTDELIDELQLRGSYDYDYRFDAKEKVEEIHAKRRLGQDYQKELDALIYQILGVIV